MLGLQRFGQLGDGTTISRSTPTDVVGLSSGVNFLAAGYKHTCAAMTAGGVKCWGSNNTGQLGDGTTTARAHADRRRRPAGIGADRVHVRRWRRQKSDRLPDFLPPTVAEAGSETCVVANAVALCWGHGALTPTQRATDVRTIAARQGNAVHRYTSCCQELATRSCAVRTDFSVTCWDYRPRTSFAARPLHSAIAPTRSRRASVTTRAPWSASICEPASADHVECAAGFGFSSEPDVISTVLTTASGLNPQSINFGTPTPTVIANVGDSLVLTINAGAPAIP
jgi:hypothetical protein